jgi:hypothetical protein
LGEGDEIQQKLRKVRAQRGQMKYVQTAEARGIQLEQKQINITLGLNQVAKEDTKKIR